MFADLKVFCYVTANLDCAISGFDAQYPQSKIRRNLGDP